MSESDQTAMSKKLLLARLQEAANAQSMIDVANFRFIGLDDIQLAYGDQWPQKRKHILETAHHFLTKRTRPVDIVIAGASGFVVVFTDQTDSDAIEKADTLSTELNEFIIGQMNDPLAPTTEVETKQLSVDDFVHSLTAPPDPARLERAAKRRARSAMYWPFQPIWTVRDEHVSSYMITPFIRATDQAIPGYLGDQANYTPNFYAELDLKTLHESENALEDRFLSGARAQLVVPVHFMTLSNIETRTRYLAALSGMDKQYARNRMIRICSVPAGFPGMYIEEMVRFTKSITPNIQMSLSSEETDLSPFSKLGLEGLGMGISSVHEPKADTQSAKMLFDKIKVLTRFCDRDRRTSFIAGEYNRSFAIRLSALGVETMSSPNIWSMEDRMGRVKPWSADGLMQPVRPAPIPAAPDQD